MHNFMANCEFRHIHCEYIPLRIQATTASSSSSANSSESPSSSCRGSSKAPAALMQCWSRSCHQQKVTAKALITSGWVRDRNERDRKLLFRFITSLGSRNQTIFIGVISYNPFTKYHRHRSTNNVAPAADPGYSHLLAHCKKKPQQVLVVNTLKAVWLYKNYLPSLYMYISWVVPLPSNSGKWRFIWIPSWWWLLLGRGTTQYVLLVSGRVLRCPWYFISRLISSRK